MRPTPPSAARIRRVLLAAVPILALTAAIPLANRVEPRLAGFPFILCWIVGWVLLTPAFLWIVGRGDRRW